MSETVKLKASDGHEFDAYVAIPAGEPIAALVVVQEIFGVNSHIRSVADGYAKDGFLVVAPALFDRVERGVQLGYGGDEFKKGLDLIAQIQPESLLLDIEAALNYVRQRSGKKVGIVGFCLGGSIAWLSAARLNPDAAVGYYGGMIVKFVAEQPKHPIILHFGAQDTHIPADDINAIKSAHPDVQVYIYDEAGHGFNCSARGTYHETSAELARERSLEFLKKNLL